MATNTILSPRVVTAEVDRTNIVPAVDVASGGTVGQFSWGPVDQVVSVATENQLVEIFREPNDTNYVDFLCAASFLSYAQGLSVIRAVGEGALNASATEAATGAGQLIRNDDDYDSTSFSSSANLWVAKYPGVLGNSIGVAWANTTAYNATNSAGAHTWAWHDQFSDAPGTNEIHVVIYDATGKITGIQGSILERFDFVSTSSTAQRFDGTTNYFKNRINQMSRWVWVGKESLLTASSNGVVLGGGNDGPVLTDANRQASWALMQNAEEVDATLFFTGGADVVTATWVITNIGEYRKDCVVFVSPAKTDVVGVASEATIKTNIMTTRTSYGSSSYAFMDSNWKYMYDRYNDKYRWVPLNGDMAGLVARLPEVWQSPAGLNRGRIKGVVKFAWKQSQTVRDFLYQRGVNPCLTLNNEGPVLFGDKTLQSKPSAFDRINVRMLFIYLEKAISRASRYQLFENNTVTTRTDFLGMVDPFLRQVKGREGVTDYAIVCDESNNTRAVIDANEFVGDIFIQPVRSINGVRLNFVATRTGVNFNEIMTNGSDNNTRSIEG